jgi:sugar (pentulose or hexulose) kinase
VRVTARVEPDAALVDAYAQQRESFRALYPALAELGR